MKRHKISKLTGFSTLIVGTTLISISATAANKPLVGLITKTKKNPYFVTMRKGAQKEASKLGIKLQTYAGKYDGDNQSQIRAIENLISQGAKGILITPNAPKAIVPTVRKAEKQGIYVIALDTKLKPASAADATFATNNFQAGVNIGKYTRARLAAEGKTPHVAMLDLHSNQPDVGVKRDQGFLKGLGVKLNNPNYIGDEHDKRIVGHAISNGTAQGGRKAAENLIERNHKTNAIYAINEPAGRGAYQALKSFGLRQQTFIATIDGSCQGMRDVKSGEFAADSMQFPLIMAKRGVKAVAKYAKTGKEPAKGFVNTGTKLVTDHPVKGVNSISSKKGLKTCWGKSK